MNPDLQGDRPSDHTPLVSVLINNYNYESFVAEAIDSALDQDYPNIEVVVVDDGSIDGSRAIIQGYGDRVKAIFQSNGGQGAAISTGVAASSGEFVTLLDADDRLYPDAVTRIVACFAGGAAQVQARMNMTRTDGSVTDTYPRPELHFDDADAVAMMVQKGSYVTSMTSGLSFRRQALEKILPVPEKDFRICADAYLVITMPFYGAVASVDEPVAARRVHGDNAWAMSGTDKLGEDVRRAIEHDFVKHKYIQREATAAQLEWAADMAFNDPVHVRVRIASLCWDPAKHPVARDSRLRLAWRGGGAIWRYTSYAARRKLLYTLWFASVAVLPRACARPLVAWMLYPDSRPDWVRRFGYRVRRATN